MQDFIDQARKNGITLSDKGKCQFCGADYQKGIFECMNNYNEGFKLLNFNDSKFHMVRFISVDAHALQHPEIHGRWSNHFHLTRLYLLLEKNQKWDYKLSPLLSDYLNEYKSNKANEFLAIPLPLERGSVTSIDMNKATTTEECIELVKNWANEVYSAWSANHALASPIAEGFLEKNFNSKTW